MAMLLGRCDDVALEDPSTVSSEEVMQLTVSPINLPAYGEEIAQVIVRIPKDAGQLDVTFRTSAGLFPVTAAKEIKAFADSIRDDYRFARVILRSDTTLGTVYITAEVPNARRTQSIQFITP
ncbi:MAG: hypothetical protein RIG62_03570 [Cyclobacteriaceae bacterium]